MHTEPPSLTEPLPSLGFSSHNRAPSPTPYREGSVEAHPGRTISAVLADDSRARLQPLFHGLVVGFPSRVRWPRGEYLMYLTVLNERDWPSRVHCAQSRSLNTDTGAAYATGETHLIPGLVSVQTNNQQPTNKEKGI